MSKRSQVALPSAAVAISGAIWGIFWIPIRHLDDSGVPPIYSIFFAFAAVGVISILYLTYKHFRTRRLSANLIEIGLMCGGCVVLYAVAIVLTEVIKVVLLFYLTPIWSTLFGVLILKEKLTLNRIAAIVLALAGLSVILGVDEGFPWPENLGDWLALLTGVMWGYAAVRIRQDTKCDAWDHVCSFYIGGFVVAFFLILIPFEQVSSVPDFATVRDATSVLAIFVATYLPSMFLIFWGMQRLSPARGGILMMTEIIFGVVSAALLSGEAVGWSEIFGITLVVGAAVTELAYTPDSAIESVRN